MSVITPVRNLIGGDWSESDSVQESVNPSTGEVVGTYVSAGRAEARAAIAAARTAFDTTGWSRDPALRSRALFELEAAARAPHPGSARQPGLRSLRHRPYRHVSLFVPVLPGVHRV